MNTQPTTKNSQIRIGDRTYNKSALSAVALRQIENIKFCDEKIAQLNNELAIADTARLGYTAAIAHETKSAK